MANKYSWTLFDSTQTVFTIPIKKSESRNYFFHVPYSNIWYIWLTTFLILLWYYLFIWIIWFNLYQQHLIFATMLLLLNVTLSTVVLFRHKQSWKNMFDILRILYNYIKREKLYLLKQNKNDIASQTQNDIFLIKK